MKRFIKSSAFITVPIFYYVYYSWFSVIFQKMQSNFLHYSKIEAIYWVKFISHCVIIIFCLFLIYRLFASKAKLNLLKSLVLILFIFLVCLLCLGDDVDYNRLVGQQITMEWNITEPGEKLIANVKKSQDKTMPPVETWESYAFDEDESNTFFLINYNKNIAGLKFESLDPETVLLAVEGATPSSLTDEAEFKNSSNGVFLFLYTADSRVVVYIKKSDEYRYFDSNETAEVVWVP